MKMSGGEDNGSKDCSSGPASHGSAARCHSDPRRHNQGKDVFICQKKKSVACYFMPAYLTDMRFTMKSPRHFFSS